MNLGLKTLLILGALLAGQISALECKKDSDCEIAPLKCCPCNQGGKLKAWNKKEAKPDCSDRICPQVISKDPSCLAKSAACSQGKCELHF